VLYSFPYFIRAITRDASAFGRLYSLVPALLNEPTAPLFAARRQRLKYEENVANTGDTLFALLRRLYVENETEATDPRDRIYRVLGLSVDKEVLGIMLDYKGDDYRGLLTRAARAMVKTNGLDVLSYSRFPKELRGSSHVGPRVAFEHAAVVLPTAV